MSDVRRQRPRKEAVEERAVLRPRRQVTLSRAVCEALGVEPGDRLVLEVSDGALTIKPGRQAALDALREIQRGFAQSGISLQELLEGGRQVREEVFREQYGQLLDEERSKGRGKKPRRSA